MKSGKGEAGYILIFLLFMITVLPLIMAFSADVITQVGRVSGRMQGDLTRLRMGLLKTSVISQAKDPDQDGYLEPLTDAYGDLPLDGNGDPLPITEARPLPLKMRMVMKDAWDNNILYCHWDLGSENSIDPLYSRNFFAPPKLGMIARLISPGEDGITQTRCDDLSSAGDDLVENIFNSDVRAYSR